MQTQTLLNQLHNLKGVVQANLHQRKQDTEELKKHVKQINQIKNDIKFLEQSVIYLNNLVNSQRQFTYDSICETINYGLKEVFGPKTEFSIEADTYGNNPSCKFLIKTEKYPEWCVLDRNNEEHGNGLVTLVSFFLRIIIHKLHGNCPDYIWLDEPFAELSPSYTEALGNLIKTLHEIFNLQFIIITYNNKLMEFADNIIEIK